ncbi:hypothetical protein ACGF5M_02975 [Gemmatimonadota bacterium]
MRKRACLLALIIAGAMLLEGCASSGDGSQSPRTRSNLITAEEIAASEAVEVLEVIRLLRPDWLQYRPVTTSLGTRARLGCFMNGQPRESCEGVALENVVEIRFVSARDATFRYGNQFPGGLIEITTRSR